MLDFAFETLAELIHRGGDVMWVLLSLSVLAVALVFERCWFWILTNRPGRTAMVDQLGQLLRSAQHKKAQKLAQSDGSVYGRLVSSILSEVGSEAVMTAAVESQRFRLERFMPTLSTIITASPMLGILGTVLGLISALQLFGSEQIITDPRTMSPAIGQALITTATGLVVAIVVLFPYNFFRSQVDRTLGRIEALVASFEQGQSVQGSGSSHSEP